MVLKVASLIFESDANTMKVQIKQTLVISLVLAFQLFFLFPANAGSSCAQYLLKATDLLEKALTPESQLQVRPREIEGAIEDEKLKDHLTLSEANELFAIVVSQGDLIPYADLSSRCWQRAYALNYYFEKLGVLSKKIFAQSRGAPNAAGYSDLFTVQSRLTGERSYTFGYHVAPVVDVEVSVDHIVPMVFDPSLFDKPVLVSEWLAKLTVKYTLTLIQPSADNWGDETKGAPPGYFFMPRFVYRLGDQSFGAKNWSLTFFNEIARANKQWWEIDDILRTSHGGLVRNYPPDRFR